MNNSATMILVAWQTRNAKRHRKALVWCKDYGLKQLLPNVAFGNLYRREQRIFINKFKHGFTKKTDRFFHIKMCQSCYNNTELSSLIQKNIYDSASFDFIQIPSSEVKKRMKPNNNGLLHKYVV